MEFISEYFTMNAFWILLTASLVSVSCALLGCFLVLRKMAMVGDAIAHAVLPGIVIAFLFSGSFSSIPVVLGATLMGIVCAVFIEGLRKKGNVQADASIGMVFTFLFAIGVILIAYFAGNVDLDQDCVLHGELAFVPLDTWGGSGFLAQVPRPVWILSLLLLIVMAIVIVGYKGLFITTFDPDYAETVGVRVDWWHYLLMSAVSMASVVSFESVGAILVVAFLVGPAATAYLLTNDLKRMLIYASLIGVLASFLGYGLAVYLDGSIAGAIATMIGVLFMIAFLFSPLDGIIVKKYRKVDVGVH